MNRHHPGAVWVTTNCVDCVMYQFKQNGFPGQAMRLGAG